MAKVDREQVSLKAGVSRATVSCVLNNTRKFSEKTKKKVFDAVTELNYIPDMIARSMKINKTFQIALVINDIANPMFSRLVTNIEKISMSKNYFVNICCGNDEFEKYVDNIVARRIDGVYIAINLSKITDIAMRKLINNGIRVVMGGNLSEYANYVTFVNVDMESGMEQIILHLKSLGHKKIAYMSAFNSEDLSDKRCKLFRDYSLKYLNNNPYIHSTNSFIDTTMENGYKMAKEMHLSGKNFTAMIATNDLMAIGAIKYFRDQGIMCPKDISIVGIDNNELTELYEPTITTFGPDYNCMASEIFKALSSSIENHSVADITIPTLFYARESTAKIN